MFGQTFCLRRATRQHNLTLWVLLARSTRVSWESAMVFMKEPSTTSTIKQWLIRRFKMKLLRRLWILNSWMISMALISGTDQGLGRRCRYLDWRNSWYHVWCSMILYNCKVCMYSLDFQEFNCRVFLSAKAFKASTLIFCYTASLAL